MGEYPESTTHDQQIKDMATIKGDVASIKASVACLPELCRRVDRLEILQVMREKIEARIWLILTGIAVGLTLLGVKLLIGG